MKYHPDGTYRYQKGDRVALMGVIEDTHDAGNLVIGLIGHPLEHLHIAEDVLARIDAIANISREDARKAAGVEDPAPEPAGAEDAG